MAKQSLFSACKRVFRDGISGTYEVGNNNIFLELYGQADIDNNNEIGNSSEENIVVVAGDTITIPEGYTLTPVQPKKSLVIICNTFVNNGTVSMYQKAPNVLPHDFYIIGKQDSYNKDIIIPAYANNNILKSKVSMTGINGTNGINRNCGSGGTGCFGWYPENDGYIGASGSGYAFGGGAGSGGRFWKGNDEIFNVDSTYPMRGGKASQFNGYGYYNIGGVGNPPGENYNNNNLNNSGCGGRIIIFCNSFNNNGTINVNGTATKNVGTNKTDPSVCPGGASGAGAVDLFYTSLISEGTINAQGGETYTEYKNGNTACTPGKGGDGSITLTAWSKDSILKPIQKYMSKANMVYFLTNYIERLKQGED